MSISLVASLNSLTDELPPALSILGHVLMTVDSGNLNEALNFIPTHFHNFTFSVDVALLSSPDDIRSLLNAGASKVFATYEQLKALQPDVEDSRLVLVLDSEHQSKDKIVDAISDTSVGLYMHKIKNLDFITSWLQEYGSSDRPPVYASFGFQPTFQDVQAVSKLAATPIVSAGLLTADPQKEPSGLPIADIMLAAVTSDRQDQLISTLVTDEAGVALGLVYSSPESVKESLKTGTGVYQSRKRGLWYKGATSGAVQELLRI
jgi:hypothetical protein